MRRVYLLSALALALLAAPAVVACHSYGYVTSPVPPAGELPNLNFGDDFGYRLFFESDGANAILAPENKAGSAAHHAFAESGVSTTVAGMQGNTGVTHTFTMKEPLPYDLWLNLSKPSIVGNVWFSSTLHAGGGRESTVFRVLLYVGDRYAGGDWCTFSNPTATSANGWALAQLNLRPEIDKLPAGQKISVKFVRQGGLSDFWVGTEAPRQSALEFRVTPFDLAASAVKLENNKLTFAGELPGGRSSPPGEPSKPPSTAAAVPVVALAGLLLPRRRRGAMLAPLLLLASAFAGCMGSESAPPAATDTTAARPTSSEDRVDDENLRRQGVGAMRGYVVNDLGLPLSRAHVVVLGTNHFTETDARGHFQFKNLTPGTYGFRVDKEKYIPLDRKVTIESGKLLWLNVTLVPPHTVGSNQREHIHDDWGDATTINLWETSFPLAGYDFNVNGQGTLHQLGQHVCYYGSHCITPVPLKVDARNVPAGAGFVEVTLDWDPGLTETKELGLIVTTAKSFYVFQDSTFYFRNQYLNPRPPKEPFRVAIFPDDADPGHQKFTRWSFQVWQPHSVNLATPWSRLVTTGQGLVNLKAVAHKGIVVPEPAHKDWWGNLTEKTILAPTTAKTSCAGGDHPGFCTYWTGYVDWKTQIPPGAKEIRGRLSWESTVPIGITDWLLAYKPGNSPYKCCLYSYVKEFQLKRAEVVDRKPNHIDFKIGVLPEEVDPFYVTGTSSNWMFFTDDQAEAIGGQPYAVNGGYGTSFRLSLTVYRDPEYKAD